MCDKKFETSRESFNRIGRYIADQVKKCNGAWDTTCDEVKHLVAEKFRGDSQMSSIALKHPTMSLRGQGLVSRPIFNKREELIGITIAYSTKKRPGGVKVDDIDSATNRADVLVTA